MLFLAVYIGREKMPESILHSLVMIQFQQLVKYKCKNSFGSFK